MSFICTFKGPEHKEALSIIMFCFKIHHYLISMSINTAKKIYITDNAHIFYWSSLYQGTVSNHTRNLPDAKLNESEILYEDGTAY